MRLVIQRVREASVTVDGTITGHIGAGLLVLAGCAPTDDEAALAWLARKLVNLRIFGDENGQMNRSVLDIGGQCW
jgi:D-tyrosyl-tRNA(Tyr) deacylase